MTGALVAYRRSLVRNILNELGVDATAARVEVLTLWTTRAMQHERDRCIEAADDVLGPGAGDLLKRARTGEPS